MRTGESIIGRGRGRGNTGAARVVRRGRVGLVGVLMMATSLALVPTTPATAQRTIAFGAHPGGTNNARTAAMTTLEGQIDRQLDFVRVFETWNSPFPTSFHDTITNSDRTMLLSVRARNMNGTFVSWRSIADALPGSAVHTQMVAWIERVRTVGDPVWFTFNHEPEVAENVANGVDDDFIDAWRRVVTEFRDRGVTNVEFVWIMTDYSFHVPSSDRRHANLWYPGDEYVDHIAADAYNWSSCRTGAVIPWQGLEPIIAPLRDFGAQHPTKGLMLAEWASTTQGGDKEAWIADAAQLLKQPGWEQIVAVSYFSRIDTNYPNCNWPIDSSPAVIDAFTTMGADPFYNGSGEEPPPPPPPPPPPGNTVITGTVDSANGAVPRWVSHSYTPATSGQHSFTLDWPGSANLRFEVRQVSTNAWVAANTTTAQPKTATVSLSAGLAYSVAVWSVSGVGVYTMTIAPPGGTTNSPPTVSVTAPSAGAMVTGTVTVSADAADDDAVTSVVFLADGASIATDSDGSDGWSVPWDTTTATNGPHAVSARATDTGGLSTTSSGLNVTVDNPPPPVDQPPTVSMTAPEAGATVAGTVTASADAADDDAVTSVVFLADGASIATDSDGSDGWSVPWDTTTATNGAHAVSARATDSAGQSTTSATVSVTVSNTPTVTVIFTTTVNSANSPNPRWVSTTHAPASSGQYTLTLDWPGTANLRFDVRQASNGAWVGGNSSTAQPKSTTVSLTGGVSYRIAVWSMSGSATFTLTSTPATGAAGHTQRI